MFGKVDKKVHDEVVAERDQALTDLSAAQAKITEHEATISSITQERDAAQATITEREQEIESLNQKLAARPGAEATTPSPKEEKIETEDDKLSVTKDPVMDFIQENE